MATPAPTPPPIPSAPRRTRSLRAFLRPYRGTRTLASGLTLAGMVVVVLAVDLTLGLAALAAMDLEARWSPVADLLLAGRGGLVLWLGVTAVTSGRMTLGTLLVVLAYLSSLYGPIRALARLARTLARGAASRERILEVLDSGEVVPQAPDPVPARPPRRGIALRGVWFAYAEGARSCATWTWRWPPASASAWSVRPAPASRPCCRCCSGSTTPTPVLYELATGTPAFQVADQGPPERRWPQLNGPPPAPSSRNPEVPAALDAAEEDRLWPGWATPRLGAWRASTMPRPPLAPRPA